MNFVEFFRLFPITAQFDALGNAAGRLADEFELHVNNNWFKSNISYFVLELIAVSFIFIIVCGIRIGTFADADWQSASCNTNSQHNRAVVVAEEFILFKMQTMQIIIVVACGFESHVTFYIQICIQMNFRFSSPHAKP